MSDPLFAVARKQVYYRNVNHCIAVSYTHLHPNAHFIDGIRPLAGMMFPLAEKAIAEQDFKDVADFEPFYLKEFVAGTPKKLI